ncbi:MAG TPA: ornithine carbamoyltransferase, partial [Polyangiaceae bacterium]|nr:ornithine carbamoyltransferase [Polyangiaceae bacterium]
KPHARRTALAGETVCLYFNKPSTRTRISFETAVARLGGTPVTLGPGDVQLGRGETIEDTARVASRFSRAFVIRTFKDEDVERLAAAASIPVINALTDGHHPCQSIADLLTLAEQRGPLDRCKVAYVGDGNNVAISLMQAAALAGTDFAIAAPAGYQIPEALVEEARAVAKKSGSEVLQTVDPEEAVRDADALYADVWLSMGDSDDTKAARHAALSPYRIDGELMAKAKSDAIFMHCLPAHRGEEVTAEVADGPRSVIFDQAENRLHSAIAILYALLEGKLEGASRG